MKKKGYHVTYDSNNGNEFVIHKPDKATQVFKQSERGIYFLDTADSAKNFTLVNTVDNNKSNYTNRDYSRACLAHQIQKTIGRPSTTAFWKTNSFPTVL
jgi:hypothetical protein